MFVMEGHMIIRIGDRNSVEPQHFPHIPGIVAESFPELPGKGQHVQPCSGITKAITTGTDRQRDKVTGQVAEEALVPGTIHPIRLVFIIRVTLENGLQTLLKCVDFRLGGIQRADLLLAHQAVLRFSKQFVEEPRLLQGERLIQRISPCGGFLRFVQPIAVFRRIGRGTLFGQQLIEQNLRLGRELSLPQALQVGTVVFQKQRFFAFLLTQQLNRGLILIFFFALQHLGEQRQQLFARLSAQHRHDDAAQTAALSAKHSCQLTQLLGRKSADRECLDGFLLDDHAAVSEKPHDHGSVVRIGMWVEEIAEQRGSLVGVHPRQ